FPAARDLPPTIVVEMVGNRKHWQLAMSPKQVFLKKTRDPVGSTERDYAVVAESLPFADSFGKALVLHEQKSPLSVGEMADVAIAEFRDHNDVFGAERRAGVLAEDETFGIPRKPLGRPVDSVIDRKDGIEAERRQDIDVVVKDFHAAEDLPIRR